MPLEWARPTHLRSLTSLRFYAALLVVLYHVSRYFDSLRGISPVAGLGYTGVGFFFILSGFVLAWSHREGGSRLKFYWHRFARVWPLHILTTALAVVVAAITGASLNWFALPFVATLTQAWIPPGSFRYAFNGVSWSLSCEIFFYLLFPAMAGFLARVPRLVLVGAAAFGVMISVAAIGVLFLPAETLGYFLYTMPLYRLGEFVIGMCAAIALRRGWRPRITLGMALVVLGLLYVSLMVATYGIFGDPARLPYVIADLWMLPAFWTVIVAAATADVRADLLLLHSPISIKLGKWSFALYLIHELAIKLAVPIVGDLSTGWALLAAGILVVACVSLSGVFYEFFERPLERWMRSWVSSKESVSVESSAQGTHGSGSGWS